MAKQVIKKNTKKNAATKKPAKKSIVEKNKHGKPLIYKTPDELEEAIKSYISKNTKYTIAGLAYELGFESRQSFYDYEKYPSYSYIIKRARLFIEKFYEENLINPACTGSIFWLKVHGWDDKQTPEDPTDKLTKLVEAISGVK